MDLAFIGFLLGALAAYQYYLSKLIDMQRVWNASLKRDCEWHEENIAWLKNNVELNRRIIEAYSDFYKEQTK